MWLLDFLWYNQFLQDPTTCLVSNWLLLRTDFLRIELSTNFSVWCFRQKSEISADVVYLPTPKFTPIFSVFRFCISAAKLSTSADVWRFVSYETSQKLKLQTDYSQNGYDTCCRRAIGLISRSRRFLPMNISTFRRKFGGISDGNSCWGGSRPPRPPRENRGAGAPHSVKNQQVT